jgi:hypothetical protein
VWHICGGFACLRLRVEEKEYRNGIEYYDNTDIKNYEKITRKNFNSKY